MALKLITPAAPVLTLEEVKMHLRVIDDDEDALITSLELAATRFAETFTGRAFSLQTWDLVLDAFPSDNELEIKIPLPPLIDVVHIAYDNTGGDEAFVPSGSYFVDNVSQPGWIVPQGYSPSWPDTVDAINSVRVRFRAGYLSTDSPPAAAIPDDIKAAIKLTIGALYENREQTVVGTIANRLPWGAEQILRQYRVQLGMA